MVRRLHDEGDPLQQPAGAFYVYPKIAGLGRTKIGTRDPRFPDFCQAMIEEAGIGFVPGSGSCRKDMCDHLRLLHGTS
jgi:aspartate/methionine/tyrosine aminotransferase